MTFNFGSKEFGTLFLMMLLSGALTTSVLAESIATINGTDIDSTVFDAYLESRLQKPAEQATADERATILDEMTDIYLITTQPRARELAQEPKVKAQLELQYRSILVQTAATDFLANNQATDQEIFNLYAEQFALAPPKEFKARHILVESQSVALGLVQELQDDADFIELAKSKSTGPSGPNGGDLGWFQSQQMVKPFSAAVAALEDGAFTTVPVQTQFGWHVIRREASRDSTPPTLESVRDVIKQRVEQEKLQKYISSLRQSSSD